MSVEIVSPIPRSDSIGQKRRLDLLKSPQQDNEQLSDVLIRIAASHAHFDIEEDSFILRQAGYFCMSILLSDDEDDTSESWI
ncbi:unnamed protein product, partial [Rotaria sp. Silwood1]